MTSDTRTVVFLYQLLTFSLIIFAGTYRLVDGFLCASSYSHWSLIPINYTGVWLFFCMVFKVIGDPTLPLDDVASFQSIVECKLSLLFSKVFIFERERMCFLKGCSVKICLFSHSLSLSS